MNVWTFSGRVGADAELRTTQSGEKVLSFRVANDVGFGERKFTQWVDCSYWGKRGEAIANYVKKGDKVTVSGELKLEEFQRRDGTPGSKLSVRVNDMDLGSGPREGGGRGEYEGGYQSGGGSGGGYQGGGGGRDYGNDRDSGAGRGGSGGGNRGGGKPAFDQDLDDEIPF
jgi:single-strand DNA-binding protein